MKSTTFAALSFVVLCCSGSLPAQVAGEKLQEKVSPVQQALALLADLHAKITKEGEVAKKAFEDLTESCTAGVRNLEFDIKTGKSEMEELSACMEAKTADVSSASAHIEEVAASISKDEADLKAAKEIRAKEAGDFSSEEAELVEIVSMLERAISILEREMKKGSLVQLKNANNIADALKVMVEASMLGSQDAAKLTSLLQSSEENDAGEDSLELGAPEPDVYKSKSGSIVETLESLLDKAEAELADARGKETSSQHQFELLQQSLADGLKASKKDLAETKKEMSASAEAKSNCESELAVTTKTVKDAEETLAGLKSDCSASTDNYHAAVKSRAEELEAIAEATKVLKETTGGAASLTYGFNQVSSFLQLGAHLQTGADLANYEAVRLIRDLGHKVHDQALTQLALRMSSAMRVSSENGADPFEKVKGLIADMIDRLEKSASADASHKAYCDKELGETAANREEKEAEVSKLETSIDGKKAKAAQLREEIAALQKSLSELAAMQAEMDKTRAEEKSVFISNKADMDQGLEGVKTALKILREYYSKEDAAHEVAKGESTGIIGLLEVVESDLTKGLAEMTVTEESAALAYEKQTKENAILKTQEEQDVKYKSKEAGDLEKSVAELSTDLGGVQDELSAVLQYKSKLQEMCIAKPETYAERTARRTAEIEGLKEALQILETQTALVQTKRSLRGIRRVVF